MSYFRNFVFGVEDSLVSTVGLLSGVAIAGVPKATILLTGLVLIFVEAFSMAAGSFLSESSVEGYEGGNVKPNKSNLMSGAIMFFSYLVSGFIPLSSYLFWHSGAALKFSIIFSVTALFVLGVACAKISRTSIVRNGVRMVVVGGTAIAVGLAAGSILS